MRRSPEPLALQIWRMHQQGLSVHEIAARLGIPPERVRSRLLAAAHVCKVTHRGAPDPTSSPKSTLVQ